MKQREIKFRARDKETKKMIYEEDFGWYVYHNHLEKDIQHGKPDGVYPEEVEADIMQFTGLKDKNGKEIYERDIVRHSNGWIYEIKWVCAGFWLVNLDAPDIEPIPNVCKLLKVIGNIYENKDL